MITGYTYETEVFKLFNNLGYNVSGEDSAANGTIAANIHAPGSPRNVEVVVDAEVDAINATYVPWWLFADQNIVDTVTLYTLNGQTTPYTDSTATPIGEARGMLWVIEHDFTFSMDDWRGVYCNSGASKL